MRLGEKLVKLRKERRMTQEELAGMLQVSRQSVSKWETAEAIPDLEKVVALADIFGVTTDYLLRDDTQDPADRRHAAGQSAEEQPVNGKSANGQYAQGSQNQMHSQEGKAGSLWKRYGYLGGVLVAVYGGYSLIRWILSFFALGRGNLIWRHVMWEGLGTPVGYMGILILLQMLLYLVMLIAGIVWAVRMKRKSKE